MSIYKFKANNIDGEEIKLEEYKGKVLLIVNTASKWGFTPQFAGLQKLYEDYKNKGFEVLGFPSNQFLEQDPGTNKEIHNFCQINYGVDFTMFEKIEVKGENAHPLFNYLSSKAPFEGYDLSSEKGNFLNSFLKEKFPESLKGDDIKWNFTKFLIDKDGNVVRRYETPMEPEEIAKDIEKLL